MNKKQIEMLRFIVKQEIEAAGIDGLYDHGAAAWTERMLDENWKDFQETFTDPDELEYRSYDSIEELFEDLHADEKIYLRRLFQKEEKEKEKISEEENEGRLKACLEQIRKLTHADLVALMGEEWLEDYRRQFQ